ncbi:hypothetical protein SAY87_029004 [Trapa incisa]|uniref:Sm domain-containing protein n=1 Tax=Trapa incisa TaxID=236973 RepID=A0AAN7KVX3_9MYRT|nr:hypothetical protein SAY87_029004 [Trapa incisa]
MALVPESPPSPDDLWDFTPEEVGKLQKELTKLLSRNRKFAKFLDCSSSLEVDRRISSSSYSMEAEGGGEGDDLTLRGPLEIVCRLCSTPAPSLRDTLQEESRMEKLLRSMLQKKLHPWRTRPNEGVGRKMMMTMTAMIEGMKEPTTSENGSRRIQNRSEVVLIDRLSRDTKKIMGKSSSMSWARNADIYFSASLATYLDKKLLVLLSDGRKLVGILRSFDQFGMVGLLNSPSLCSFIQQDFKKYFLITYFSVQ